MNKHAPYKRDNVPACSDPSSGIRHAEVAIGKTSPTSDDVHPWTLVNDPAHPTLAVGSLPEAVALWVRVRLTNNGKLSVPALQGSGMSSDLRIVPL